MYQHLLRAAKNANPPLPHAAMLVLREMRMRGDEPAVTHYNLVVSACARAAAIGASVATLMPLNPGDSIGCGVDCENGSEDPIGSVYSSGEPIGSVGRETDTDVKRACRADAGSESGSGGFQMVEREEIISARLDGGHERGVLEHTLSKEISRTIEFANEQVTERKHGCSLSAGWKAMESRGVEATVEAWRLALDVIADMRKRGVAPSEVTYKTLVECCRSAAAAPSPLVARDGGIGKSSTPAEIYTALKEAGIPTRFCYEAGLRNALKGGRRFPEYAAAYR